jgi:hypothetical protein
VQFARRGWLHRNRLVDRAGALHWLTLPLQKATREVLIRDLRFAPNAAALFGIPVAGGDIAGIGARRYINASGGRSLYDAAAFAQDGIELHFPPDYAGPTASILTRLLTDAALAPEAV